MIKRGRKDKAFLLSALLIAYFLSHAPFEASAQLAKETANMGQKNYAGPGDDIRSYEIICEAPDKKDYAAYYKIIRDKIKERLKNNYIYPREAGDVILLFTLNFDGSLIDFGVDRANSTADKELVDKSMLSLKQASPFPPFPKTFLLKQMSFNVKIVFKKD